MRLREWFRPPRHALLIFLGVAALSGVALGWLGWLLLEQDQAVETQRRRERLDDAADRAVATMQRSIADLEGRVGQPAETGALPVGVTLVSAGKNGIAASSGLLYYPEAERLPEAGAEIFTEAERLEFASANNMARAAGIYERLADSADAGARAGALTRLARVERKLQHVTDAERAYDRLARVARAGVSGLPAGLIAREGRASLYQETHRTRELAREAAALQNDLRAGRWQLNKEQYESYSADAAAVAVSPSHFARRFRAADSRTPMRALADLRAERAETLLRDMSVSTLDAGLDAGFQSASAFVRAFRRRTGLPPATWRRSRKGARR